MAVIDVKVMRSHFGRRSDDTVSDQSVDARARTLRTSH